MCFITWERHVNSQDIELMFARSTDHGNYMDSECIDISWYGRADPPTQHDVYLWHSRQPASTLHTETTIRLKDCIK